MGLKNASEKHGGRQTGDKYELKMTLTDPEGLPDASAAREITSLELLMFWKVLAICHVWG